MLPVLVDAPLVPDDVCVVPTVCLLLSCEHFSTPSLVNGNTSTIIFVLVFSQGLRIVPGLSDLSLIKGGITYKKNQADLKPDKLNKRNLNLTKYGTISPLINLPNPTDLTTPCDNSLHACHTGFRSGSNREMKPLS